MKYVIELTEEQGIMMKELIEKRKTMNRRCTHLPFYSVQTRRSRPVLEGYGEDKMVLVHTEEGLECNIETEEELIEVLNDNDVEEINYLEDLEYLDIEDKNEVAEFLNDRIKSEYGIYVAYAIEYYYEDVAFFLTEQEAFDYCKYQSHNLCHPITYGHSTGYANRGYFPTVLNMLDKIKIKEIK